MTRIKSFYVAAGFLGVTKPEEIAARLDEEVNAWIAAQNATIISVSVSQFYGGVTAVVAYSV